MVVLGEMQLNFTEAAHTCDCGATQAINWAFGPAWRCGCGLLWYVDPAGRVWGDEAIRYANKEHGYFKALVEQKDSK